jgi:heme exporter protein A
MSGAPLLRFAEVACRRGGKLLFERIDFSLGAGEAMMVTGPNGAGKSSLLRLAAGLLDPWAGTIERRTGLALADEAAALDPRLSLRKALCFWAGIDGSTPDDAMDAMGLAALADVPVHMLSTGQRKRATLARVLASRVPVWLLDEPGNGLDADAQLLLAAAMAEHRRTGGAILAASHQQIGLETAETIVLGAA